jgi:hypothetical protein
MALSPGQLHLEANTMQVRRSSKYLNKVYRVSYQDVLDEADTSGDVALFTAPPGSLIDSVLVKPRVKFTDAKDATYTDGVFNSSTTLESENANFVASDAGKTITGAGIPADTTIDSVTDENTIILSAATTTTGTGKTFTIVGRTHITALTGRVMTANHNYGTAFNILQAPGDEVFDSDLVRFREKFSTPVDFFFRIASTGGNLSTLTAGEVDIIVNYDPMGL